MIDPHNYISKYVRGYTVFKLNSAEKFIAATDIDHKVFYFCLPHMNELCRTEQMSVVLHEISHAVKGSGGHDVEFYKIFQKICKKEKLPPSAVLSVEPYAYPEWFLEKYASK